MALTLTNRVEGVTVDGKRSVTYTAAFSDGAAADITKAVLGLKTVDAVWIKALAADGSGVDLTANDATKITLDPVAACTCTIAIVGS